MKNNLFWIISIVFLAAFMVACTNEYRTKQFLTKKGFSFIKINGFSFNSCPDNEFYRTSFTAYNQNGKKIKSFVCCGLISKCRLPKNTKKGKNEKNIRNWDQNSGNYL